MPFLHRWPILLIAGALLAVVACKPKRWVSQNFSFAVPDDQIEGLRIAAEAGDGAAAFRLFQHYDMWKGDYVSADEYLQRAVCADIPAALEVEAES